jgi:protoheme IX farnesyltransferase
VNLETGSSILQDKQQVYRSVSLFKWLVTVAELAKIKITIFVAFTSALGFILAADSLSTSMILPVSGIFLLACSSAVINQIQEWQYDAVMKRTMNRPIPTNKITLTNAWVIAVSLFVIAVSMLIFASNILTIAVSLLTMVWYNLIYTPLKRKTGVAIIPGSFVGALPPLAGWLAAGGSLFDTQIWILFSLFFLWQIPHFWLLLILFKDDYKAASFPVFTDSVSVSTLEKLIIATTLLTSGIAIFYAFTGAMNYFPSQLVIVAFSVFLAINSFSINGNHGNRKRVVASFLAINFFTLIFITILILDKLLKIIL